MQRRRDLDGGHGARSQKGMRAVASALSLAIAISGLVASPLASAPSASAAVGDITGECRETFTRPTGSVTWEGYDLSAPLIAYDDSISRSRSSRGALPSTVNLNAALGDPSLGDYQSLPGWLDLFDNDTIDLNEQPPPAERIGAKWVRGSGGNIDRDALARTDHGQVKSHADDYLEYTGNGNLDRDSFSYGFQTTRGRCSNEAEVTIEPVYGPIVVDDRFEVLPDEPHTVPASLGYAKGLVCLPGQNHCDNLLRNDANKSRTDWDIWRVRGCTSCPMIEPGLTMRTSHGMLTVNDAGGWTYDPDDGFEGIDTFYYAVVNRPRDNVWAEGPRLGIGRHTLEAVDPSALGRWYSDKAIETGDPRYYGPNPYPAAERLWAEVEIVVGDPPEPPAPVTAYLVPDFLRSAEDTVLDFRGTDLTGNDYSLENATMAVGAIVGDTLSHTNSSGDTVRTKRLAHGTLEAVYGKSWSGIPGVQTLRYTPDANYDGIDTFEYVPHSYRPEGDGVWTLQRSYEDQPVLVTIDNRPRNDAPTAVDDVGTVSAHAVTRIPVLDNDVDEDENLDATSLQLDPACDAVCQRLLDAVGEWEIVEGKVVLTPQPRAPAGVVRFPYRVADAEGLTDTAVLEVTIVRAPSVDDAYATDEDVVLEVPAPGVFENDFEPVGDGSVAVVTEPAHGELVLEQDGSFTYLSDLDYNGDDSFVYRRDGDDATVRIDVRPVADAPRVFVPDCEPGPGGLCPIGDPLVADEGGSISLEGVIYEPDESPGSGTLHVDWGDGTTTQISYPCDDADPDCGVGSTPTYPCVFFPNCGYPGGPFAEQHFFALDHTYADDGALAGDEYEVTVTATDDTGEFSSTIVTPVVRNLAPLVEASVSCPDPGCEVQPHEEVTLDVAVSDPGSLFGVVEVDWGDGSTQTVDLVCDDGSSCSDVSLGHVYELPVVENESRTIEVTVTETDGTSSSVELNVVLIGPERTRLAAESVSMRPAGRDVAVTVQARLSTLPDDVPVEGRSVSFWTAGGDPICSGVTDRDGVARCEGIVSKDKRTRDGDFEARFSGEELLLPSSSTATLVECRSRSGRPVGCGGN